MKGALLPSRSLGELLLPVGGAREKKEEEREGVELCPSPSARARKREARTNGGLWLKEERMHRAYLFAMNDV
jgi:hypothetical protein